MADRTMTGVFPVLHIPYDPHGNVEEEDLRRQADLNCRPSAKTGLFPGLR